MSSGQISMWYAMLCGWGLETEWLIPFVVAVTSFGHRLRSGFTYWQAILIIIVTSKLKM